MEIEKRVGDDGNVLARSVISPVHYLPDDNSNLDCSIAMVYQGPPVSYNVPKIDPLDVSKDAIPLAELSSESSPPSFTASNLVSSSPATYYTAANTASPNMSSKATDRSDLMLHVMKNHAPPFSVSGGGGLTRNPPVEDAMGGASVMLSTVRFDLKNEQTGKNMYSVHIKPREEKKRRFTGCYRCKKRRWEIKVCCLVCDAKYCSNCILRGMGSMPEGRKCVSCIGCSISESKRPKLGKFSRFLYPLETEQVKKAEKGCLANQLHPEQLVVNGYPLKHEEMGELLNCPCPPKNLKPGRYWYDKDSGLWGKEGEKPHKIVTPKLNLRGRLNPRASNGTTEVFINGREITKIERRVLRVAKVPCSRDTHYWVYCDGRYQEEGQNDTKGNIYEKACTRFVCKLFSLPVPRGISLEHKNGANNCCSLSSSLEQGGVRKLLLLGLPGSGTSTIFKQTKFLYGGKFTTEELKDIKLRIQSNIYRYLSILLDGRERFEEESMLESKSAACNGINNETGTRTLGSKGPARHTYSINARLKHFSNWLLDIVATGDLDTFFPAATREYAPLVEELWKDPAIQETYKRRDELSSFPDVAEHFLSRALEISSNEYEPSELDILYAEGAGQGNRLSFTEFTFDDHSPMSDVSAHKLGPPPPLMRYQLIRVPSSGAMVEGRKWIGMFEGVRAVIMCVALSDYNEVGPSYGLPGDQFSLQNKMIQSKQLFEDLITHPCFARTPFVLILNKFDLFEEKINSSPLNACDWFRDFGPVGPTRNQSLAHQAYYYVAMKFKDLYASATGRKLFVWQCNARERVSVCEAFKYIREVIKWDEEREKYSPGVESLGSIDVSTEPSRKSS